VRDVIQRAIVCALASVLLVAPAGASGASQSTVTITLHGSGTAFWKLDGSRETGRLTLSYRWHGALRFAAVSSGATLVGSWTGSYRSKKGNAVTTCSYKGTNVKSRVTAKLAKGRTKNTLELTLHPRAGASGFFSDKGHGAVVRCSSGYAQSAPSHFAPSWFFRDDLQDHGRLSSDTAIIVLPATLLPRGSVTVAFPNERGRNDSVALGHIAWNNRAQTAVRAG
jgi:hypothetical protein